MYFLLIKVISLFVAVVFLQNVCWNISNKNYLSIQGFIDNKSGFLLSFTENFDRQMRRINSKGNRKIISVYELAVYEPDCLASTINNSQSDNCGNKHLPSKSYKQPNRNSKLVMLIDNSNLLPELNVCSIEDRGQVLTDFGNITSLYQQEEELLSRATDLVTKMFPSEESNDIKENSHGQIAHKGTAIEPKVLLNTLSEKEITSNVDKFTDGGNKIQVTFLNFKHTSSSHAAMFYNSFESVEKTLDSNYNERKIVAQQQFKSSLNPGLTDLGSAGQRFSSNTILEKDKNDSEEGHTSNNIVYYLIVVILENLPNGIYKNLDSQYHRIIEEYDGRKRKGRKKIFLHVIFAMEVICKLHFVIIKHFVTTLSFLDLLKSTKAHRNATNTKLWSHDHIYIIIRVT